MPRGVRRAPVIATPDGTLLRPDVGEMGVAVILEQVGVYGAYEGRVDGTPKDQVAVNVSAAESDLTVADPRELLLGVAESTDSTFKGVAAPTSIEIESRQRVWRFLVLVAVLLLLAESVIASRGWRGRARRAIVASPVATSERSQG